MLTIHMFTKPQTSVVQKASTLPSPFMSSEPSHKHSLKRTHEECEGPTLTSPRTPRTPPNLQRKRIPISPAKPKCSKYVVHEEVGKGAYARVYKVSCEGHFYALKKVSSKAVSADDCASVGVSVLREMAALKRLGGKRHVIDVVDVFADETNTYIVMPFVPQDLHRVLAQSLALQAPFSLSKIRHYMHQLVDAMAHAHSHGVLHRDLKPANILVDSDENLWVADWGLSRSNATDESVPLTEMVITRWYRPPELLMPCDHYTSAVDIWSLGCIMVELFLGKPLFCGNCEVDQLLAIFKTLGTPSKDDGLPQTDISFTQYPKQSIRTILMHRRPMYTVLPGFNDAVSLMDGMLQLNPTKRITALEALAHPFFQNK